MNYKKILAFSLLALLLNSCQVFNKLGFNNESEKGSMAKNSSKEAIKDARDTEALEMTMNDSIAADLTGDSLSFIDQIFEDTLEFANAYDNRYGKNDYIEEDLAMLQNSEVVRQLDSLACVKFFKKYSFETDTNDLNICSYEKKEVPLFSDSVYELRIEVLNAHTPLELVYNQHVKGFINLYAKRARNQTARMLGLKEIYFPIFEEVLDKYDMPLELKYLAVVESALNPTATSRAGAKGLWQFMFGTGKLYGLTQNSLVDDRFDPYKATDAAARHLKDLYEIYGTWELALAAYNSGPGNVNRAIRRAGGVKDYWAVWKYLPSETRGYVPAFIAVNYVFNYAAEHNIYPVDPGILYYGIDSISVYDALSFDQISEFLKTDMDDLTFLNPAYKEGVIPATKEQPYVLRLPREKMGYFIENEDSLYSFKTSKGIEKEQLMSKIKKSNERTVHVVRKGDNLGAIAKKYHTSVSMLRSWNGLRNNNIWPGQKLIVYAPGSSETSKSLSSKKTKSTDSETVSNDSGESLASSTDGVYVVRKGDNLGAIGQKFGVTVDQLKKWNELSGIKLKIGQKIRVVPTQEKSAEPQQWQAQANVKDIVPGVEPEYLYHTIRPGDTLWDLAKKYNSTVEKIKKWNGINNSYKLKLGQRLIVGTNS
jgi:membrane-bound lytic murein transglycosylase D